jgi:hypothetical protein
MKTPFLEQTMGGFYSRSVGRAKEVGRFVGKGRGIGRRRI